MTYTLDSVLRLRPCPAYTPERLLELAAGRERLTHADILDLPISPADRLWLLWRSADRELVSRVITRTVTRLVTRDALHCGAPAVETWAAAWLSGDDQTEHSAREIAGKAWEDEVARSAACGWKGWRGVGARAARAASACAAARSPESRVAWAAWAGATSSLADDAELAAQLDDWRAVLAEVV